jgi:hypothetical protein
MPPNLNTMIFGESYNQAIKEVHLMYNLKNLVIPKYMNSIVSFQI